MLRSLGVMQMVKWFMLACVGVAIWQAYDGNLGAIADSIWGWVQAGADVVQNVWDSINSDGGGEKKRSRG